MTKFFVRSIDEKEINGISFSDLATATKATSIIAVNTKDPTGN
jgi:hypothetical protein